VLVYGVYEFAQPSQPPPANVYWVWILAIVVGAAAGTAAVYLRRPGPIARAGAIGPEFVQEDA
jgi:hypothetical protein